MSMRPSRTSSRPNPNPSPKPDPEAAASGIGGRGGRVPFIGLTGGIGAGKSTALEALERVGAAVLSTDRVVHDLYESAEVVEAVSGRFGEGVAPAGVVDRAELARRAFATPEERAWLEGLLWPRVGARMAAWRGALDESDDPPRAAVVEVPLLFESGMEGEFDATIAVVADEDVRAERAGARGHEALAERSARQLSQQEKAQRATYVVVNEGSVEELESKLSALLEMLRP
jgi:dephospho-CoA kinase